MRGLPKNAFQIVTGDAEVGKALVASDAFRMITFTGGERTANAIVRSAGARRYAMDLGGNAPVLVFNDADLELAVEACLSGAYWANGHNCISVQRIIVESGVYQEFADCFVKAVNGLCCGDPAKAETQLGPMIGSAHADQILLTMALAQQQGAEIATGGGRNGNVVAPIVLKSTPQAAAAWSEEAFGPLVNIVEAEDFETMIALANDASCALHAGVFTNRLDAAVKAADALEFSGIMINESSDFRFDGMPFGGFKRGSIGREGVKHAIGDMTQSKSIAVNLNC